MNTVTTRKQELEAELIETFARYRYLEDTPENRIDALKMKLHFAKGEPDSMTKSTNIIAINSLLADAYKAQAYDAE